MLQRSELADMEKNRASENLSNLDRAVVNLVGNAFKIIDTKYGPESPNPLHYHGPEHTHLVVRSANQLALAAHKRGKITDREIQLLRIGAAYHDIEFETSTKNDTLIVKKKQNDAEEPSVDWERLSAERAANAMAVWPDFSDDEIDRVKRMILATKVKDASPEVGIVQSPDKSDYLTKLMVDADTSSLGAPVEVYWDMAQRYFAEDQPGVRFSSKTFYDFVDRQKGLVANHKYQTVEARRLFNHQPEILEFLDKVRPKRG